MTTPLSPQAAAMQRLEQLLTKAQQLHTNASYIVDTALNDSVALSSQGKDAYWPTTVSDNGLVQLTKLRDDLGELVTYYANQKEVFASTLNAIAERNAEVQEAMQQAAQPEESAVETVDSVRERIARLAAGQPVAAEQPVPEPQPEIPPMVTNRPDRTAVAEAAAKLIGDAVRARAPQTPVVAPGGLPAAMPVVELQPENPAALRPPENSVQRLLSADSPLLDIFSMAPWLTNGKGFVTVGTPGFKWYKGTNPLAKSPAERAALPTGFYAGEDVPQFVVLRMTNCILIWSFALDPARMSVYMVGLSDVDPANPRWFLPSELAASHSRQLITELIEVAEKVKAGVIVG